ncbi:MAG: hypothetical protein DSY35_00145 [Desulfurobacterium sp.]|nr:MAG: hypothetical protein DSY35_00145 [Desulfurobacterium sp.]
MNRLLDILMVFLSAVIAISIGVIVAFYPSDKAIVNTRYAETKELSDTGTQKRESSKESSTYTPGNIPEENTTLEDEINKKISSSFKKIKEGIVYHPALILKVKGVSNGTEVHLITFSTMEWPFIRTYISDDTVLERPERVYLCEDGIVDISYTIKGIWPPEIHRGKLEGKGILVTPDEKGNLNFNAFNGNCTDNGFVFTDTGEFAGICFGSKFIGAEELYRTIPSECQTIYPKEEGRDADIQGENG